MHGNAVYLHERDCSLQRRHQKVIEEAPAPGMPEEMRRAMGEAAVAAVKAIGYRGAGTVEFIADGSNGLRADAFWFMEMNTRLQVEHPVTEAITGTDLVEWQLRVAAGERLPLAQKDIPLNGHAVEVRLYAEDPAKNFFPSTGKLTRLRLPEEEGIRADMGVEEGDEVSMFYDPMIGKIIAHGEDRTAALAKMRRFLLDTEVAGPRTNLAFLAEIMGHDPFREADIDTGYIDRHIAALVPVETLDAHVIGAALVGHFLARAEALAGDRRSPWVASDSWTLGGARSETLKLMLGDEVLSIRVTPEDQGWRFTHHGVEHLLAGAMNAQGEIVATVDGLRFKAGFVSVGCGFSVILRGATRDFTIPDPLDVDVATEGDTGALKSPMPGKIVAVMAEAGVHVKKGTGLVIMEAMKMEQTLAAAADGIIASVNVAPGDQVEAGAALVVFEVKKDEA